jgi:hypothetical protein
MNVNCKRGKDTQGSVRSFSYDTIPVTSLRNQKESQQISPNENSKPVFLKYEYKAKFLYHSTTSLFTKFLFCFILRRCHYLDYVAWHNDGDDDSVERWCQIKHIHVCHHAHQIITGYKLQNK